MKKRIVCLTLAILMCGSQVVSVMADRESDLREEQAWTSQQLDATYARMSALWDQKQQLESQIESLNSEPWSGHPVFSQFLLPWKRYHSQESEWKP